MGVVMVAVYLRTRDLLPLAIAHWLVDVLTGALTLLPPRSALQQRGLQLVLTGSVVRRKEQR